MHFLRYCFLLSLAWDLLWSCQLVYVAGGPDRCAARPPKKIPASLSWKQPRASEQTHLCIIQWWKLLFWKSTAHRPETLPGSVSVINFCVFSGLSSEVVVDENWSVLYLFLKDGHFNPEVVKYRQLCFKSQYKRYLSSQQQYFYRLLKQILASRNVSVFGARSSLSCVP